MKYTFRITTKKLQWHMDYKRYHGLNITVARLLLARLKAQLGGAEIRSGVK